ncbi:MAG: hypothetical protein Q9179_002788 [Wetmoreana sp. 5 TL-2023]
MNSNTSARVRVRPVRMPELCNFSLVGDPQQLPSTVPTKDANTAQKLVKPFARQMPMSTFERLWRRRLSVHMLTEQYRLVEGLEEVFNNMFYNGRIANHPSTQLVRRPDAQKAIDFIFNNYNKIDGIPHIFLAVPSGVCLRGNMKSRYNIHDIAVVANLIRRMLRSLFTEEEITVIMPYHEQASRYRDLFRNTRLFRVQVSTVDSMHGRENCCIIFDTVNSHQRSGGGPGFLTDPKRLCVASSRSRDCSIVIGDTQALVRDQDTTQPSEDPGGPGATNNNGDRCKHIRAFYNYFASKGMVHLVDPMRLPELQALDMTEVNAYHARQRVFLNATSCKNFGEQGHVASQCDVPRVRRRFKITLVIVPSTATEAWHDDLSTRFNMLTTRYWFGSPRTIKSGAISK